MIVAILKGISGILNSGLKANEAKPGSAMVTDNPTKILAGTSEQVPRAYVENAKSMLDSLIDEMKVNPPEEAPPVIPGDAPPAEPGLDGTAQAAKNELEV